MSESLDTDRIVFVLLLRSLMTTLPLKVRPHSLNTVIFEQSAGCDIDSVSRFCQMFVYIDVFSCLAKTLSSTEKFRSNLAISKFNQQWRVLGFVTSGKTVTSCNISRLDININILTEC